MSSTLDNVGKPLLVQFSKSLAIRATSNYRCETMIINLKTHFNNDIQAMENAIAAFGNEEEAEQNDEEEEAEQNDAQQNANNNIETSDDIILHVSFSAHPTDSNEPISKDSMQDWVKRVMKPHIFCDFKDEDGTVTQVDLANELKTMNGPTANGKTYNIKKLKYEAKRF